MRYINEVGDGGMTSFWSDIWLGESPLLTQFPHIFNAVRGKNYRVRECYGLSGWRWRKILSGFIPTSSFEDDLIRKLKGSIAGTHLEDCRDRFRWRWSNSETFTVKSMYLFLQDSGVSDVRFIQLWKLKLPLKVKNFVWLVLRRRVMTADKLLKRGWNGAGNCVFCLGAIETADHLFATCVFTRSLFICLLPNMAGVRDCSGVQLLWEASEHKEGSLGRRGLVSIAATWWTVWLERNRRCFDDKKRGLRPMLTDIRALRELWTTFCQPNFGAIQVDWNSIPQRLKIELRDLNGESVAGVDFFLSELQLGNKHITSQRGWEYQHHCSVETDLPWILRYRLAFLFFGAITVAFMAVVLLVSVILSVGNMVLRKYKID